MKHIFGVSSHLAFYLCNKLIQTDSISIEDCVFFTSRDYNIPKEYQSIYTHVIKTSYNVSSTKGRIFAGWKFWDTLKNIRTFDKLVDDHIKGEKFIWYTQICNNDICNLMVTKKNCVGYYIIEDGSGSYKKKNETTFKGLRGVLYHTLLKPLFPRLFIVKNRMIETDHPKFKGCIATNDKCFPLHKNYTRVIGLPFIPTPLKIVPDAIISIDALYLWISDDKAKMIIQQLAAYVNNKGYQRIAYKHHPYTYASSRRSIYQKYNQWINDFFLPELQELSPETSIENSLMAHRCDFYTAVSSISIYANEMGVKCYSYKPLLRPYVTISIPLVDDICIPIEAECKLETQHC